MEEKRRIKKNELKNEIKECESVITRSNETIGRLKTSNMGLNYVTNQISILKEKIENKTKLVEELNKKIEDVKSGLLDDEIQKEYDDNKERSKSISLKYKKKKEEKKREKDEKKKITKEYWDKVKSDSKERYDKKRDIKYQYKYFTKVCESIPDYLLKNLKKMPNNKGYIWRGVYCYGDLPAEENQPNVLFEKKKGGILLIHEHRSNGEYRRYEKIGRERKKLVHKEYRKPKVNPSFLSI